ncbi:MAG: glycosyltransferase family 39 protein [Gemmataceae bacterium]|nr:glycosyltransferase family 39 protein [Gemmataceae bacterium]MDW8264362.1 glycosyltransferase family 39 protein [Gemmataceae bacterium]
MWLPALQAVHFWGRHLVRNISLPHGREAEQWLPALLPLWCVLLFFYGLNAGDLWRTEGLRAIIGAEFLRSGNWIVPTLYGEPLLTKPPGMYAAIALASWPVGEVRPWTARLPSAVAATATVLLFYGLFRRYVGRRAGLVAALVLPVSVVWLDKAGTAEIDMVQVFWVAAAIGCLIRAVEAEEAWGRPRGSGDDLPAAFAWWLGALLCLAGGVLTKWTAPAFFYGMAVPFLWWRGRLRLLWSWRHLTSLAIAVALCLAWAAAAITNVGWETFYRTVSREALQRLSWAHYLSIRPHLATNHQTSVGPVVGAIIHPAVLLVANLPWSLWVWTTLRPSFAARWDDRGRFLLAALHCWTWPNVLFWSLLPDHTVRHSFPLFPGIVGLAVMVLVRQPWRLPMRPREAVIGLVVVWLLVKVIFVEVVMPRRSAERAPREKGAQLAAAVPPGQTLYLFRLKDEGIMFYYGRPVRRLPSPQELPPSSEPLFCILGQSEWQEWPTERAAEVVLPMRDEQGAPIVLVRVAPQPAPRGQPQRDRPAPARAGAR